MDRREFLTGAFAATAALASGAAIANGHAALAPGQNLSGDSLPWEWRPLIGELAWMPSPQVGGQYIFAPCSIFDGKKWVKCDGAEAAAELSQWLESIGAPCGRSERGVPLLPDYTQRV